PVTSGKNADACGIVVAGRSEDGHAHILADLTVQGLSPVAWARAVVRAFRRFEADKVVAEVNQGGELVGTILREVDPQIPLKLVHATRGKILRAEPIAALYEQRRVHHIGAFAKLEDQMCEFTGNTSRGSPDRLDALVWAVTELLLDHVK